MALIIDDMSRLLNSLPLSLICRGEFYTGYSKSEIQGRSWYDVVHWEYLRDAQSKHRLISQSEQEKSCILLMKVLNRSGSALWVHCVLQVKDSSDSSQQPIIVCTNQVLRFVHSIHVANFQQIFISIEQWQRGSRHEEQFLVISILLPPLKNALRTWLRRQPPAWFILPTKHPWIHFLRTWITDCTWDFIVILTFNAPLPRTSSRSSPPGHDTSSWAAVALLTPLAVFTSSSPSLSHSSVQWDNVSWIGIRF